jgi:hypothetical protein
MLQATRCDPRPLHITQPPITSPSCAYRVGCAHLGNRTQRPPRADDFTIASMNATPFSPSVNVGKCAALLAFGPPGCAARMACTISAWSVAEPSRYPPEGRTACATHVPRLHSLRPRRDAAPAAPALTSRHQHRRPRRLARFEIAVRLRHLGQWVALVDADLDRAALHHGE